MTLDEEILAEARSLRSRLLELQHDAERAQVDYHHAIRRLQAAGGSLREIAAELGLSHQRVHQIVGADAPGERQRRGHGRKLLFRFTRPARELVELAEAEARALGHGRVGTEHLLLGATLAESGGAAAVLASSGVTADRLREALSGGEPSASETRRRHLPYTPAARRALRNAIEEAARLRSRWIGSEHVLLGLLATERGGARDLVSQAGADVDSLRSAAVALVEQP
jgi:ATP-dependent Clp protease ATP-binding subunit ClpA